MNATPTRLLLALALSSASLAAHAQSPWVAPPVTPWQVGTPMSSTSFMQLLLTGPSSAWLSMSRSFTQGGYSGVVYVTNDEGQTWTSRSLSSFGGTAGARIKDCWTLDGQLGWAVFDNYYNGLPPRTLQKTTTGATGFAQVTNPAGEDLRYVRSFSANVAFAVVVPAAGGATLPFLRSTDGGQSWQPVATAAPARTGEYIQRAVVLQDYAWIPTSEGDVLRGSHQGNTWQRVATGLGTGLRNVVFRDTLNGLAYGNARLSRTTDGGRSWQPVAYSGSLPWRDIAYVPGTPATYLAVGGAPESMGYTQPMGSAISTDDGLTWTTLETTGAHGILAVSSSTRAWTSVHNDIWHNAADLARYAGAPLAARPAAARSLALYPNPSTGRVYLPAGSSYQRAVVYDALGRRCRQQPLSPGQFLDLTGLAPGPYHVELRGATATQTSRVLLLPE